MRPQPVPDPQDQQPPDQGQPPSPPEQGQPANLVAETVDALGHAVKSNARKSSSAKDVADDALKFAQAALAAAQAIAVLVPPTNPNDQAKTEADLTKHGADLAFREQDAARQADLKLSVAKVAAESKPAGDANVKAVRDTAQNQG
jgi:hypothetical protein